MRPVTVLSFTNDVIAALGLVQVEGRAGDCVGGPTRGCVGDVTTCGGGAIGEFTTGGIVGASGAVVGATVVFLTTGGGAGGGVGLSARRSAI